MELTIEELMVFVVLGFAAGVFTSFWLSKAIELVHMWRLFRVVLLQLILMCVKITEDVAFLGEVKRKHMHESGFTNEQIRNFEEVDNRTMTNWKDSAIMTLVQAAPPAFKTMMPFNTWKEAVRFLEDSNQKIREENDELR